MRSPPASLSSSAKSRSSSRGSSSRSATRRRKNCWKPRPALPMSVANCRPTAGCNGGWDRDGEVAGQPTDDDRAAAAVPRLGGAEAAQEEQQEEGERDEAADQSRISEHL